MDKRVLGQIGENAAADVLRAKGYIILRQNYRCRHGEQATRPLILAGITHSIKIGVQGVMRHSEHDTDDT